MGKIRTILDHCWVASLRRLRASGTVLLPVALLCTTAAWAHEGAHDTSEDGDQPGLTLSLGAGARHLSAEASYPYPRLPGVLEAGSARADMRGTDLDYAELGLRAHFAPQWDGALRLTYHGGSDSHTELEASWIEGRADQWRLSARAGRQEVPLGFENLVHAHARTFGIAPLIMRAAVEDAWIADGLRADWGLSDGWSVGAGAWHNRGYPGVETSGVNLATVRLGWKGGPWRLEAGYVDADADGRALLTTGEGRHTHSVPSCDTVSADRVCFSGDVAVWSVAARWQPQDGRWWLGGEYWYKKETGSLDSIYGVPDYEGEVAGGWMDVGYRITETVSITARAERLQMSNYLNGTNAGLIAAQTGVAESDGEPNGVGLVAAWRPWPALRLLGEWHQDDAEGRTNTVVLLRVQVSRDFRVSPGE